MELLRETIEKDLAETLEGEFQLPVFLMSPDGIRQQNPIVLVASDLSFDSSDNTINSTVTDFYKTKIEINELINISGSVSNDAIYTVEKITKNKITVTETVIDEVAGSEITVINTSIPLVGQVLFDTLQEGQEIGTQITVHKPVVTLRRTSLVRVPIPGEKWFIEIPTKPKFDATKEPFITERIPEDGSSIGVIRLYLTRAVQS